MIKDLIINKTSQEKSQIKSLEIAKLKHSGVFDNAQTRIEIIGDVKIIEINGQHGIELFARAWKDGKQLGFGDGSVEIERFRIFNPPILIDDPNGTIIREWTDEITKELKQRKLREDPIAAIRETLAHTIKIVGEENTKIIRGKIGSTTSTFYPDPDIESTSVDGWVRRQVDAGEALATIIAGAGTVADDSSVDSFIQIQTDGTVNPNIYNLTRAIFLFNTASIPDTDNIDSATLSLWGKTPQGPAHSGGSSVAIVSSTPASNTALVAADYSQIGSTEFATRITFAAWLTAAYNDFTLNASGRANISKTGVSKFAGRISHDIDSSFTPWESLNAYCRVATADTAGTTNDPKLVVVHSVAVTANPAFFMNFV